MPGQSEGVAVDRPGGFCQTVHSFSMIQPRPALLDHAALTFQVAAYKNTRPNVRPALGGLV